MAKFYTVNEFVNTEIVINPKNNHKFQLEELQNYMQGDIEIISLTKNLVMVINENGVSSGLPYNFLATQIMVEYCPNIKDVIIGNAIVCSSDLVE